MGKQTGFLGKYFSAPKLSKPLLINIAVAVVLSLIGLGTQGIFGLLMTLGMYLVGVALFVLLTGKGSWIGIQNRAGGGWAVLVALAVMIGGGSGLDPDAPGSAQLRDASSEQQSEKIDARKENERKDKYDASQKEQSGAQPSGETVAVPEPAPKPDPAPIVEAAPEVKKETKATPPPTCPSSKESGSNSEAKT